MDNFNWGNLIPLFLLVIYSYYTKSKQKKNSKIIDQLKKRYPDGTYLFCTTVEKLDTNLFQFYGDIYGGDVTPLMKLELEGHGEYTIKEVYAADNNPDKPDQKIKNNSQNIAIIVESNSLNITRLQQQIKQSKVLAIPIIN